MKHGAVGLKPQYSIKDQEDRNNFPTHTQLRHTGRQLKEIAK